MKRWGKYVNPNTRRQRRGALSTHVKECAGELTLYTPGKRMTPHWKAYKVTWQTWVWFIWLLMKQHHRHPQPFNKTERGKARRAERRFKQEKRHDQEDVKIPDTGEWGRYVARYER